MVATRHASAALLLASLEQALSCTTLIVGKKASTDGSVLLSHSDDSESGFDARLCRVPGKDFASGSKRPVYYAEESYPRYVGHDRGNCYLPKDGQNISKPIGTIPQVSHTFAYFEGTYGLINEKGVGMGESTCSGVFGTSPAGSGGNAVMSIDELSRLAMERSSTAREAIKIMGALAEEYGFYGPGSFEGTAESLMVGDGEEGFMFHILPDPTGKSAIWAARRVPDDEVGVVANMFVIREIDFEDEHNFLFSDSVRSVAADKGWWKEGEPLDFTKLYSDGEYAHKFYSGRRIWGAYRRFGLNFTDNYTNLRYDAVYPVTSKPVRQVNVSDIIAIHRDHYEGTKYDLTQGLAAGPYGDPDRYSGQVTGETPVKGNWERSIALYRTSEVHVVQARSSASGVGTVLWYGPHNADATVFVPIPAMATAVPKTYDIADPDVMDRGSAYWAHRYVFNVAKIRYNAAMQDVRALQHNFEDVEGAELIAELDRQISAGRADAAEVTKRMEAHTAKMLSEVWKLPDLIVTKYADGWLKDSEPLGYPGWWLKAVGYEDGPGPAPKGETADTLERCVRACPAGAAFTSCLGACQASDNVMVA